MKKKIYIYGIALIVVVALIIYSFGGFFRNAAKLKESINLNLPSTYQLTQEDSDLFQPEALKEIQVDEIFRNSSRNPILSLIYGNKYSVIVNKINYQGDTINKIVEFKATSEDISENNPYRQIYIGFLDANFNASLHKQDSIKLIKKIYLNISGKSINQLMSTDTVIGYNVIGKSFSIKYSETGPIDILAARDNDMKNAPSDVSFEIILMLKKKNLYLLLITPKDSGVTLTKEIMSSLISPGRS